MTAGWQGRLAVPDLDRERALRVAVPVGLGVLTWFLLVLLGGVALGMGSLSPGSLLALAALAVLFAPLWVFEPWRPGVTDRVLAWAGDRRGRLRLTAGLFVLVHLPFVSSVLGPLVGVLLLPTRAVPQVLFGVTVVYGARFGDAVGSLLLRLGRWYVELLWLYTLAAGVAMLGGVGGSGGDSGDGGGGPDA